MPPEADRRVQESDARIPETEQFDRGDDEEDRQDAANEGLDAQDREDEQDRRHRSQRAESGQGTAAAAARWIGSERPAPPGRCRRRSGRIWVTAMVARRHPHGARPRPRPASRRRGAGHRTRAHQQPDPLARAGRDIRRDEFIRGVGEARDDRVLQRPDGRGGDRVDGGDGQDREQAGVRGQGDRRHDGAREGGEVDPDEDPDPRPPIAEGSSPAGRR